MTDARRILQQKIDEMRTINEHLKEMFSVIGIPRETWIPGHTAKNITENLIEISIIIKRIQTSTQNDNHQLENCINKLRNVQKSQQESEALSDISQLFN